MSQITRSYGLFWLADEIYWGKGVHRGELLGVPASARSSVPVDFRDQIGIYVLYMGDQMIYVGQTGSGSHRLLVRLKNHRRGMLFGRWDRFSWFGLRAPLKNGKLSNETIRAGASIASVLNHMEAILIASAEPVLNRQGGRFGSAVKKFLQVRDPRLGPTTEEMIKEMWKIQVKPGN